jgi:hypothetical protein
MPFFMAFLPQNFNETPFSVYNEQWDGLSEFRDIIETQYPDMKINTLLGSANALNRLNGSAGAEAGTLVIVGPKTGYDFTEAIAILLYAAKGGRVIIADDFGTANDILEYFSMLIETLANTILEDQSTNLFGLDQNSLGGSGSQQVTCSTNRSNPFPIVGLAFNRTLLVDTQSFYKSPVQPIFTPPPAEGLEGTTYTAIAPWLTPMIKGVDKVIGNLATIISMKVRYPTNFTNINNPDDMIDIDAYLQLTPEAKCDYSPSVFETIWVPFNDFPVSITKVQGITLPDEYSFSFKLSALYSSQKSFLEYNVTSATKDVNRIDANQDGSEWGNIEFPIAIHFPFGNDEKSGSLTLVSDPSIFINRYLKEEPYPLCTDFNVGVSCEQDPDFNPTDFDNRQFATNIINMLMEDRPNSIVYFDVGHLANSLTGPTFYMGTFFRYLDMFSMFPLLAPLLPLTVYFVAKRLAPKGATGRAQLITRSEQYAGRSYFAYKMRWFLEYRHFTRGLELIYRRTKRDLIKRYKLSHWSPEIAYNALASEYSHFLQRKDTLPKLNEIEKIIQEGIMIEEEEFMPLYLTLKDISDHIKK